MKKILYICLLLLIIFTACFDSNDGSNEKPSAKSGTLTLKVTGIQIPEEFDSVWINIFPENATATDFTAPCEAKIRIWDTDSSGSGSGITEDDTGNTITLSGGNHLIAGGIWKNSFCVGRLIPVRTVTINGNTTITLTEEDFTVGLIEINSVSPEIGLVNNTATDFTVAVTYMLRGTSQGEISIGFNNGSDINTYRTIMSASVIINEGSGTHTFNVNAVTKDWGASGDFKVLVVIFPYPYPTPWVTLGSDRRVLTFE